MIIHLHGRPESCKAGPTIAVADVALPTLELTPPFPPLAMTFDQAATALDQLENCFFEPDGAFFYRNRHTDPHWELEGELYDNGQALEYVTLRIRRQDADPARSMDLKHSPLLPVVACFGAPAARLVVQLARQGVVTGGDEFLQWFAQVNQRYSWHELDL